MTRALEFRMGAEPSPPDPNDFPFADSELRAGVTLPAAGSISITDAHRWHRGGLGQLFNNCVGVACVTAIHDLADVLGVPMPDLASLVPYSFARLFARAPKPGELLPDTGSQPRLALKSGVHYGFVGESEWPETAENVGLVPPMDVWQNAQLARVKRYTRIVSDGSVSDFRDQLRAALLLAREGKAGPPMFSMPIYANYFTIGANVYDSIDGEIKGHHMQNITAIDSVRDCVEVPATWPRDRVGDGGLFRISVPLLHKLGREFWIAEPDLASFKAVA